MRVKPNFGDHLGAVRDEHSFLIFVAPRDFGPPLYPSMKEQLEDLPGPKLLDLTAATRIELELFEFVAENWTALPGAVPRLGFVLPFDAWAVLRDRAMAALKPVADRGIEIAILYQQQAQALALQTWFAHGRVLHDVPEVLDWLLARWTPSKAAPLVLDAVIDLVRTHAFTADVPPLLVDSAAVALLCGDAVQAESLAREALYYLPAAPSPIRANALLQLGTAMGQRGQRREGIAMLDQAATMANAAEDLITSAASLLQAGVFQLEEGACTEAECRFREVIKRVEPLESLRDVLATAHHNLAVSLVRQGRACGAERHVIAAIELRSDPSGPLAEQDRRLLSTLLEQQSEIN